MVIRSQQRLLFDEWYAILLSALKNSAIANQLYQLFLLQKKLVRPQWIQEKAQMWPAQEIEALFKLVLDLEIIQKLELKYEEDYFILDALIVLVVMELLKYVPNAPPSPNEKFTYFNFTHYLKNMLNEEKQFDSCKEKIKNFVYEVYEEAKRRKQYVPVPPEETKKGETREETGKAEQKEKQYTSEKGEKEKDTKLKEKNYYEVLGVSVTATTKEIRSAYRKLALENHPDKNPNDVEGATKRFQELLRAYQTLSNPQERNRYDQEINLNQNQSAQSTPSQSC